MPDGLLVLQPSATASIQGEAVKVDTVQIVYAVNSFPSVNIGFHDAKIPTGGVVQMADKDVAARIAKQQNAMFSAQSPDSSVTVDDGINSISFSGYVSSPSYTLAIQNVGFTTSIIHEASAVNTLRPSIYTNKKGTFRSGETPLKSNIGAGLIGVLDLLMKESDPALPDEESKGIVTQIDTNNQKPIEIWRKICQDSTVEWPELEVLLKYPSVKTNLQDHVAGIYTNSSPNDFFQSMNQFRALFSMIYVPSLDAGKMGKFISEADAATMDPELLPVNIRSISMSAGPKNILPLAYVVTRGPKPQTHRDTKYGHIVQRWPLEAQSTGQVTEIGTPSWLPAEIIVPKQSSASVGDTLDLNAYELEKVEEDKKLYEVTFPEVAKVLERWAKQHYVDFALSSSTAKVVTELTVQVTPGKRYTVVSPNGVLFRGFLTEVVHTLSSVPRNLQASTELIFSYVEADGFELPSKS
jgi:hypothetical protein